MQPNQETPVTSLQCPSHNHPLTTFCTHKDCSSSRLLCEECQKSHPQEHQTAFKTYQDLLQNDEILKNLQAAKEKQTEKPDHTAYLQQVDSYFQDLLTKMTQKINEMSQQVQGAIKESLEQENNSHEKFTQLEENLTALKSSLTTTDSPQIQQIENYLKAYTEAIKITEQPPSIDLPKLDFASISNLYQDFEKQADMMTSRFLSNFKTLKSLLIETSPLTLEKILPIPSKMINPGCLAEIKNNCFVLGAMDGKVSVWDANNLQVIKEKFVHNLRVTSLLYMAGYDLLISAGEDRRLCVSRFGKGNDFMTFMQTPQDQNVTCLTELGSTGTFVGLYGQSEIGIWCIKLTKFKGNEYYEILPEGKIQTNQKVKAGGKIVNIPGKDMIAVEFEIGLIGFFCLKQRKLMFGIYAEALLSGFWYCEKRQKLYAQISPEVIRVWDYSTDKVNFEGNIDIKSKAKEPYFTLVAENNVFCCGGSEEIIAVDLATKKEKRLGFEGFKPHGLVYLESSKKLIATNVNHENLAVIKVKENNLISF